MIDFVITWVDGNDPEWKKEFSKYLDTEIVGADKSTIRYREWNNLQYWFRGVEKFAPWVNNIYLVTWGHYPKWLNINHPKLKIINHSDFIPKEYLPTFSSRTIELNLHRIKDLSEQFVLFNDDTFLLKPVKSTFFFKKGLPVDAAILNIVSAGDIWAHVLLNEVLCINRNFSKNKVILSNFFKWFNFKYGKLLIRTLLLLPWTQFHGFYTPHLPQSFLKSSFDTLWRQEFDVLHKTCCSKYRNITGVNQYLVRYWQLVSGNFIPANPIKRGIKVQQNSTATATANIILKKNTPMLCINDYDIADFEEVMNTINAAFDFILPNKSAFEL